MSHFYIHIHIKNIRPPPPSPHIIESLHLINTPFPPPTINTPFPAVDPPTINTPFPAVDLAEDLHFSRNFVHNQILGEGGSNTVFELIKWEKQNLTHKKNKIYNNKITENFNATIDPPPPPIHRPWSRPLMKMRRKKEGSYSNEHGLGCRRSTVFSCGGEG